MNRPEPPSRARLEEGLEITVSKTRYGRGYEGREHDLRYIDSHEGQYALRQRFPGWQLHLERQPRRPESVDHSEPEEASSDRGCQHPPPRCARHDGGEGKPGSRIATCAPAAMSPVIRTIPTAMDARENGR